MTHFPNTHRPPSKRAFTLVELLVVLAIIAVVGSGIAVTYGRKNIEEAKDRMTLHEMGEIKKAFLQFENDNYHRLQKAFADHEGNILPTASFVEGAPEDEQFEAKMEFYETYGLWFLMQPTLYDVAVADRDDLTASPPDDYLFPVFEEYDNESGEGWNGPYLDVTKRQVNDETGINVPQIADPHGSKLNDQLGIYRIVYFQHDGGVGYPTYRRLLLISPRSDSAWDEMTDGELLSIAGNMRVDPGEGLGRFDTEIVGFSNSEVYQSGGYFVLELLENDDHP